MKIIGIIAPTYGLEHIFTKARGFNTPIIIHPHHLEDAERLELDIICFSGGTDINPALYNQKPIQGIYFDRARDHREQVLWNIYKDIPKIGVCRGAQLLCALNGGSLWQNIEGHEYGTHPVVRPDGIHITITNSVHHQACRIKAGWPLLAEQYTTAAQDEKKSFSFEENEAELVIPEAFYIPEDKALCVQFHPEFGHPPTTKYFFELCKEYNLC